MAAKRSILIVDDCHDDREMYSLFLAQNGFQVAGASDGAEAVQKAFKLLPDLIVMDLWLPTMGGWEATRCLKADDRTKNIPVVVLTARSFVRAESLECDSCLIKPCPPDVLQAEILRVLRGRVRPS